MNSVFSRVRRFLVSEDGPTAVEYAVMLALIVVVCVTVDQEPGHEHQRHVQLGPELAGRLVSGPGMIDRGRGRRSVPARGGHR